MTALLRASAIAAAGIVAAGSVSAASRQDTGTAGAATPPRIEWAEFKKLYDAKKIEVVDVRGSDAFKNGHVPGARSVPMDDITKRAGDLKKLGKPIVTYCACTGEDTSVTAAERLRKHGVDARALIGGYHKWLREEGRAER